MLLKARAEGARRLKAPLEDNLRFDRRSQYRANTCGRVLATFRDESGGSCLTWMDVLDSCETGLGLRSPVRVPPGTMVEIHSPCGTGHSSRRCRVSLRPSAAMAVACERDVRSLYRVGVRLSRNAAA